MPKTGIIGTIIDMMESVKQMDDTKPVLVKTGRWEFYDDDSGQWYLGTSDLGHRENTEKVYKVRDLFAYE